MDSLLYKIRRFFWRAFVEFERHVKLILFRCSMCGQCILSYTGFICPMQCPKQLRNGPCGGTTGDKCEVGDGRPCVWYLIYKRNARLRRLALMDVIQPPVDWSLWQTSAWLNLITGKIAGPKLRSQDCISKESHGK